MNGQTTNQDSASRGAPGRQATLGGGPADAQNADDVALSDHNAIMQASRSVMHPERGDPEWRYYHSAVRG